MCKLAWAFHDNHFDGTNASEVFSPWRSVLYDRRRISPLLRFASQSHNDSCLVAEDDNHFPTP